MNRLGVREYQYYRSVYNILKEYISNENWNLHNDLLSPTQTLAYGSGDRDKVYAVYLAAMWHTLSNLDVLIIDDSFDNFASNIELWKTIQFLPITNFSLCKHTDLFAGDLYKYNNVEIVLDNGKQLTILSRIIPLEKALKKYDLIVIDESFLIDNAVRDIFSQLSCKKKIIINK